MSLKNIYIESCFSDLIRLASKNRFLMRRYVHSINIRFWISTNSKMTKIITAIDEIFQKNVGLSRRKWLKSAKITDKRRIQIDEI
ncbi:hypothetical protein [Mesomycoplasma ovipneumoniae]|uniref:hypothetical protein n=1 Tax=Mesomycoplasma ovipneumoniae TaxID=29562 RepID=UPI00207A7494|nr:hypothetical protein [Mesomycoplasma ovipneumoniae]MCN0158274.1 hypothetical protein [Mesomycoplasma ovipneumoniae]